VASVRNKSVDVWKLHNNCCRFREEGNEFLQKVVATDETWIRDFEPELKSQPSEWRGKGTPRPKKFKRAQSNVKQMMIFAYDCKGVIMTDRVPSGTTVTAAYYCQFLQKLRRRCTQTDQTCWKTMS